MSFVIGQSIHVDDNVAYLLGTKNIFSDTPTDQQLWRSRIRALSKSITLVENDYESAQSLLGHKDLSDIKHRSNPHIIGLTGLPGAGKSTLTSLLIKKFRDQNKKVAVLAVDPSSQLSGGAVLGDRVRMQDHFKDDYVFIRSMGSRGALGGVSYCARSVLGLIKLLPFDVILVESVGVGQSESDIVHLVDTCVLVLMPYSGDDVQLMKAGVLQMADIFVINKCDLTDPARMIIELEDQYGKRPSNEWSCPVVKTSCLQNTGLNDLAGCIDEHKNFIENYPFGQKEKDKKIKSEILQNMIFLVRKNFTQLCENINAEELKKVKEGRMTSLFAARRLMQKNKI